MPPHLGHLHLCRVGQENCDRLTVLVCTLPGDPVPGPLRYGWMRMLLPEARVLHLDDVVPQAPEDHPDFWEIWSRLIRRFHPEPIDVVFASEDYGFRLARELDAEFHMVDRYRLAVPVSGTAVRADPAAMASFLPEPVRHWYAAGCPGSPVSSHLR